MMVKRFTTSVKEGVPDGIVGIPLIREVPCYVLDRVEKTRVETRSLP